jgi:2-polyprenyl-3-methyl-5-hydroxy-6-metoxy-1,4-benzoquinol methylase
MNCPLCASTNCKARIKLDNDFEVHCCAECTYQFVLPRPSIEELKAVYEPPPPGTFGEHSPEDIKELGLIYHELITKASVAGNNVLEVGCNTGFILSGLKKLGYRVTGTDLSTTALEYAKKYYGLDSIYLSDFPPEHESGSFDVLIASHIIEHVLDPRAFVDQCSRFLKPGGICIIRTPNVDSLGIRTFRGHYPVYCPPIHLNYFSTRTLSSLLLPRFAVLRSVTHSDWTDPRNTVFNSCVAVSHMLNVKKKLKASAVLQEGGSDGEKISGTLSAIRRATQISERLLFPVFALAQAAGAGENILMIARKN